MKILIVTWYFPPANTIAAVRLRSMARAFLRDGHDVRVLAAAEIPAAQTLSLDFPEDQVSYTPWADVLDLRASMAKKRKGGGGKESPQPVSADTAPSVQQDQQTSRAPSRSRKMLRKYLLEAVCLPDSRVGWIPYAYRRGKALIESWRPDAIYASGPPFSTNVIGYLLSRKYNIPLVTEFRDRWADDPYYPPSKPRQAVDRWMEARIVNHSKALVTVSPPWQEAYQARYDLPTFVAFNGYDPAVLDEHSPGRPGDKLVIGYTGGIYVGRRDPSPLFQAMAGLPELREKIAVEFYGTQPNHVLPLADKAGVREQVACFPPIPYDEAVHKQQQSDILLLMQWNDPREQGNVPGKFFEYLGARRPILLLGLEGGVPHRIIQERNAGLLGRSSDEIAAELRRWTEEKASRHEIPELPESASKGFAREEQFAQLSKSLRQVFGN